MKDFLKQLKESDYLELFSHALNHVLHKSSRFDNNKIEVAKAYLEGLEQLLNKHGYEIIKKGESDEKK